jgi:uncharacterized repeat protein (TIGR04138 family)
MSEVSKMRRMIIQDFFDQHGKYAPDAYEFVTRAVIEQVDALEQHRHLTALEVLQNLRRQLDAEFGWLASAVLAEWKINCASDIGEIIYDLIEMHILSAAEDDKRSDFDIDFNLQEQNPYRKVSAPAEVPKID